MIRSFKHQLAADLFFERVTGASRKFPTELRGVAKRKLQYLNAAANIGDLRLPPGNRLEALKGDLIEKFSIRIVFKWDNGPKEVEVVDYH